MPEDLGSKPEELYSEHKRVTEAHKREQDTQFAETLIERDVQNIDQIQNIAHSLNSIIEQIHNQEGVFFGMSISESKQKSQELVDLREFLYRKTYEAVDTKNQFDRLYPLAQKVDKNHGEAEAHFRQNEEAYKQQAVEEAKAAGKDILYPAITGPVPPPAPED